MIKYGFSLHNKKESDTKSNDNLSKGVDGKNLKAKISFKFLLFIFCSMYNIYLKFLIIIFFINYVY